MSIPHMTQDDQGRPDLPEYMSWDELEKLPEEIARWIELWDGRVVWNHSGTPAHQHYTIELRNALKQCARLDASSHPEQCWRATAETDVFLQYETSNDFLTPDFMVYRCLPDEHARIHFDDVVLVGEVRSPSNTDGYIRQKKRRYASAGIPFYWEVELAERTGIANVTVSALEVRTGQLAAGAIPLRPANYIEIAEWTPDQDPDGVNILLPYRIHIPWADLEP
ncbi:Uma2 family endonuclease [Nocardia sp. NPDC050712]|uniref:Uma2 family endonuclease n=1 Tax=Nocardia sp. NPDC050712 TaxID=3155518 RepID=UPI0033F7CC91